jgi:flagellar biosynthetic protein FlhB
MADTKEDDDKTEEPTLRKLEEAIKKGDVAKSVELNTFFILGGFTLAVLIAGGHAARESALSLRAFLMNAHQVPSSGHTIQWVTGKGFFNVMVASAGVFGIVLAAALAGCLVQHKPLWTFEPMTPKLSKLSLQQGAKRIFGKDAIANFIKGILKVLIVGVVVGVLVAVYALGGPNFTNTSVPSLASSVLVKNRSSSLPSPILNRQLSV